MYFALNCTFGKQAISLRSVVLQAEWGRGGENTPCLAGDTSLADLRVSVIQRLYSGQKYGWPIC